ncbi:hypothiocyanous acid reductase MerA [Staphylococcus gallinarum]|uniref:hypothiocyanous acid reductase MerA n=1 Tax=Staphylococcus gallinarum TaxID=1293 RepID=UPI002DBFDD94|nr:hypothiocyanous acid reductase MerA [Staphylococcus gallinarum]MEB6277537.1 FAD-dependent oxidoreductase [Staphylococcus gallinarum]
MVKFDIIILGFGQGGKVFAKEMASTGKKIAVIEKNKLYGGTCINIGCIPSKVLAHDSIEGLPFEYAINRKHEVVQALNKKNFNNLDTEENITIFDNKAEFKSNKEVNLLNEDNEIVDTLVGDKIIINTGASPIIPDIKGIDSNSHIVDSTGLMSLEKRPNHLVIIGGGYISLEFASIFSSFGSKVTIIEKHNSIMPKEDNEVVEHILNDLRNKGIEFIFNAKISEIDTNEKTSIVKTSIKDVEGDTILVAVGRKPNTDLALENTDISLGDYNEIKVNEYLETTAKDVYAIGDVKGGMQFTYISKNDRFILKDTLYGEKQRTTLNRDIIPYTVFIDPPLSRVGLTAKQANSKGYEILEKSLPVSNIPRHKINNDSRGLFKVVIDKKDSSVLGASLYGEKSEEIINIIKLAIDYKIPYQVLKTNLYTHPTMSESFNDLFSF